MATRSAGILLYRAAASGFEVFVAHMGGPFWAGKLEHAWSIPKGEFEGDERALEVALREFGEEIGVPAPELDYQLLGEFRMSSGKVVTVFTASGDDTIAFVGSNDFELEWPPRSGRMQRFPEMDDARWASLEEASTLLVKGQLPILSALRQRLTAT